MNVLLLLILFAIKINAENSENLNPKPRNVINEGSNQVKYQSAAGAQENFRLVDVYGDSVIIGARDAVYNLSIQSLDPKFTIQWPALGQTIEECHMKGKSEAECHNFIRVVAPLRNGRTLICGTHAFSPQCREYDYNLAEDRFVDKQEYSGQAIAPYDPRHNSTYVYLRESNDIFVGTVSDFGGNDPLIYRKRLPRGESLRTQKDDLRVIDYPDFVGSFVYKEHVYFWYREKAAESMDNNHERQTYARVGRVCANDHGGPSPAQDRWSSFLKARLNCSVPADVPFYFNELQSISDPIEDGNGDAVVFGVFQTSRSSVLLSAVCAFRMSSVQELFDHGRFKTQRTPQSAWIPNQRFYTANQERPGKCVMDSRRLSDVSFIIKNPLMYDLVQAEGKRPLLVEGPAKPELTAIHAIKPVKSVRGQLHNVIYVGRHDGTIGKIVETARNQTTVLAENVRVFENHVPVIQIASASDLELLVVAKDRVIKVAVQHCDSQTSCSSCVRLRDPHCAWDISAKRCVHRTDWSRGSFVQNVLTGISEQCPSSVYAQTIDENSYAIDVNGPGFGEQILLGQIKSEGLSNSTTDSASFTVTMTIIAAIMCASLVGFLIGYRISKYRAAQQLGSPVGSSNGSDCDSYGRARLTRHDSLIMQHKATVASAPGEHIYSSAPVSRGGADTVSLVFNASLHGNHMPVMTSISNGGSGLQTPRHAERNLMLGQSMGATLPRDYRVRKVYL
ncbi:unnamed protein product [Bursaphelenchus xylophilus]|uniref:Semaphorin-1A n=1 Tax=Bursaphelenchus xylophilus TaxID=6326 RepID=A0A1I7S0Z4_BURXY|nr:unnamed protein product [Bursaphelenchus xylophilus]CAG9087919.1 unnamed protein product [Bursaphelenchus xylophilus]